MTVQTVITPNLPAVIAQLPDDRLRAEQAKFTRGVQTVFLEALSRLGSVRGAARCAGVSHQTAYRARRACRAFRRCWQAAMLANRALAEDALACRAIEGVEEKVFYHGEEVATRRRYCSRLLLAHLARLDRLAEDEDTAALAEDFDDVLEAFGQGDDLARENIDPDCAEPRQGGEGEPAAESHRGEADRTADMAGAEPDKKTSPGEWSKRSMSPLPTAVAHYAEAPFWRREARQDPGYYNHRWLARVHAMLLARGEDAVPFDRLIAREDIHGEMQQGDGAMLRDCIQTQVLGYEYGEEDWQIADDRGHPCRDAAKRWAAQQRAAKRRAAARAGSAVKAKAPSPA